MRAALICVVIANGCANMSCCTGCVSATGVCLPGTENALCGMFGQGCVDCTLTPASAKCFNNMCQ